MMKAKNIKTVFDLTKAENRVEDFLYIMSDKRYGLAIKNEDEVKKIAETFFELINMEPVKTLINELKKKDYYTYIHVVDTFILGTLFSNHLNLPNQLAYVKGCLMHDIGKLNIPSDFLQFNGPLKKKQFEEVKLHTLAGEDLLNTFINTMEVAFLARDHHERLDGSGYPHGVTEENLTLEAKALMIIDVYSAMTLDRPYRAALSSVEALTFLLESENQFDQKCVKKFLEMLHIFPVNSTVRLSNKQLARVVHVPSSQPYLPDVEILETEAIVKLREEVLAIESFY
ncbi:HD-GYP domain-containing protein [Salipaludibacillus sp. HK11]|uniref:HD-GYP domain-containing protein n=1 Tax=Salipaludibacillus sp. HK11 TaxID=3394320 RepID=UPI0039FD5E7E